jgi:hypothetical protein
MYFSWGLFAFLNQVFYNQHHWNCATYKVSIYVNFEIYLSIKQHNLIGNFNQRYERMLLDSIIMCIAYLISLYITNIFVTFTGSVA